MENKSINTYFHSVSLERDACKGCTNCLKRCPTEAIRVRNGKAKIVKERCVDCGACIRVCPYHAKKAVTDPFEKINNYKYKIALPAPTLYGQFKMLKNVNLVLAALKEIGFDEVYDVATGADLITEATKLYLQRKDVKKPVINSACPAVVKLIQIRFPNLVDHILPIISPMECIARVARKETIKKTGLKSEEIGIFFISPCAAKMATYISPVGTESTALDGVLSMTEVYAKIAPFLFKQQNVENASKVTSSGLSWALSGGETGGLELENSISVSGIDNVIKVLEEVDDEKLDEVDFVECLACVGGCVGGILAVENSFVASSRIAKLSKTFDNQPVDMGDVKLEDLMFDKEVEYIPVMSLGKTFKEAMEIMNKRDEIYKNMPRLDCGSCGAPSCEALSEDIAKGYAKESDCIFKFREKLNFLINEMNQLDE
ncbi:MAG: 4Fe-4S dicluster domain-containing protein [Clostridia bacterium]|nr:4Fe-4S dicluster domain-containing protein [Clostridia bacterium]